MSALELLRTLVASYLIITLASTALAKARNRRVAVVGIKREMVVPSKAAGAVLVVLVIAEFALATLLMIGSEPAITGFATAALFILFAAYRLLVAAKTKSLTCSCAGTVRTDPASLPSVVGASTACIIMAALGCAIAFLGPPAYPINFIAIAAWVAPLASLAASLRHGLGRSNAHNSYPSELLPLWTAEINAKQ
jgi:hypothetical protein